VPNLNVGLVAAIAIALASISTTNVAYAAACTYSSTYTSGTTYTGAQCQTLSAVSYFSAGGQVKSCNTCRTGYTRVATSKTHSSGCTFTMYDCVASANYATVVADCSSSSLSTLYTNACNGVYGNYLGSSSTSVINEAGLSSEYDACGVYNIKYASSQLTAKVIMCFKSQILFNGTTFGSIQVSKIFSECDPGYHADDYTTQYVITDWSGNTGATFSITNYAQWDCCNNTTSCMGYAGGNTTNAGDMMLYYSAKTCSTTGTCGATTAGGYITCNTGYYSAKGLSKYTLTSSNNPANYASYLNCTSCATATSNTSATSDIGASAITQCYLPAGYDDTDTTGAWKYDSNCNYTK